MPLILQPSLTDQDLRTIEAHLDETRAHRLQAAIMYQRSVEAKLGTQAAKAQERIDRVTGQLIRAVNSFDAADERVVDLTQRLTILLQEQGLLNDIIQSQPEIDEEE